GGVPLPAARGHAPGDRLALVAPEGDQAENTRAGVQLPDCFEVGAVEGAEHLDRSIPIVGPEIDDDGIGWARRVGRRPRIDIRKAPEGRRHAAVAVDRESMAPEADDARIGAGQECALVGPAAAAVVVLAKAG